MKPSPSPNGVNGSTVSGSSSNSGRRDTHGRFVAGNGGGPGNPNVRRVASWRATLVDAVTDDDLRAAVRVLVERAKAGESWAVRELLDRCIGRVANAPAPIEDERPTTYVVHVPNEDIFKARD